jgi:hypothetical protein
MICFFNLLFFPIFHIFRNSTYFSSIFSIPFQILSLLFFPYNAYHFTFKLTFLPYFPNHFK